MNRRSNSSFLIRQNLLQNLHIEKIQNNVPISHYFAYVASLFTSCLEIQNENYIGRSYCAWKQFTEFVTKELFKHRQYKLDEYKDKREWCKTALAYALQQLELIVYEMDKQEDAVQQVGRDIDLIDEFDSVPVFDSSSSNIVEDLTPSDELEIKRDSLRDALKILYPTEILKPAALSPVDDGASPYPTVAEIINAPTHCFNFLSIYEAEILKQLWPISRIYIPEPQRSLFGFHLVVNSKQIQYSFYRHDFQISYSNFFVNIHPDLKSTKCAIETNRCFFIHLGVAMNIHPFAIQCYFRNVAATRIHNQADPHALETEILQSCLQYAGFVDANCLNYIWPLEFQQYRILLISGSMSPIFSLFYSPKNDSSLVDILIHSDGSHFTLLKPIANERTSFSIIPGLLQAAKSSGCVVQEIAIDDLIATTISIETTLQSLIFST